MRSLASPHPIALPPGSRRGAWLKLPAVSCATADAGLARLTLPTYTPPPPNPTPARARPSVQHAAALATHAESILRGLRLFPRDTSSGARALDLALRDAARTLACTIPKPGRVAAPPSLQTARVAVIGAATGAAESLTPATLRTLSRALAGFWLRVGITQDRATPHRELAEVIPNNPIERKIHFVPDGALEWQTLPSIGVNPAAIVEFSTARARTSDRPMSITAVIERGSQHYAERENRKIAKRIEPIKPARVLAPMGRPTLTLTKG